MDKLPNLPTSTGELIPELTGCWLNARITASQLEVYNGCEARCPEVPGAKCHLALAFFQVAVGMDSPGEFMDGTQEMEMDGRGFSFFNWGDCF